MANISYLCLERVLKQKTVDITTSNKTTPPPIVPYNNNGVFPEDTKKRLSLKSYLHTRNRGRFKRNAKLETDWNYFVQNVPFPRYLVPPFQNESSWKWVHLHQKNCKGTRFHIMVLLEYSCLHRGKRKLGNGNSHKGWKRLRDKRKQEQKYTSLKNDQYII